MDNNTVRAVAAFISDPTHMMNVYEEYMANTPPTIFDLVLAEKEYKKMVMDLVDGLGNADLVNVFRKIVNVQQIVPILYYHGSTIYVMPVPIQDLFRFHKEGYYLCKVCTKDCCYDAKLMCHKLMLVEETCIGNCPPTLNIEKAEIKLRSIHKP